MHASVPIGTTAGTHDRRRSLFSYFWISFIFIFFRCLFGPLTARAPDYVWAPVSLAGSFLLDLWARTTSPLLLALFILFLVHSFPSSPAAQLLPGRCVEFCWSLLELLRAAAPTGPSARSHVDGVSQERRDRRKRQKRKGYKDINRMAKVLNQQSATPTTLDGALLLHFYSAFSLLQGATSFQHPT